MGKADDLRTTANQWPQAAIDIIKSHILEKLYYYCEGIAAQGRKSCDVSIYCELELDSQSKEYIENNLNDLTEAIKSELVKENFAITNIRASWPDKLQITFFAISWQ